MKWSDSYKKKSSCMNEARFMANETEYDFTDINNLRNAYIYMFPLLLYIASALPKESLDFPLTQCNPIPLILPNTFISKSQNLLLYISLSDTHSWLIPRVTSSLSKKCTNIPPSEYLENLL